MWVDGGGCSEGWEGGRKEERKEGRKEERVRLSTVRTSKLVKPVSSGALLGRHARACRLGR